MKKVFTFLFAGLLSLCVLAAHAQTIRRVNNTGVAVSGVNVYSTLQAAHDAASSGDIIYLEPSNISYGDLTCIRPLTIIGNGYFLQQNTGLQLDTRESIIGNLYFNNGSAGSRVTGCVIQASYLSVNASNIVVERNQINVTTYVGYHPLTGVYNTVSGVIIRQNYSTGTLYLYPNSNTNVSSVNITNNIFATGGIATSSQFTRLSNILISNNVIGTLAGTSGYSIDVDNAVIKNNILTYTGSSNNFPTRNNAYSYNIAGNTAFGTNSGNQQNVSPANLFVGGTASTDGAYQLRTGSNPANGTGESGTDVGAFGGAVPYRLSGIPNVPTIYQYNQSVSGNSLNATISTRSNN